MSTATLSGQRATHARLTIPAYGLGWADVTVDGEITLSGSAELKIADLTCAMTIMSGGPAKGRSYYRAALGAGGWGRTIAANSYSNDAGVKTSTVLVDAATACGETLDATTLPATRVGSSYVREAGPASQALQLLSPGAWYVGEDGITRLGKRAATTYTGHGQLGVIDLSRGTVTIAAEEIVTLLPGITVEGLEALDIVHEVAPDAGLRTTLYGAGIASTSRRLEAYRRIIDALFPALKYANMYEYRVVTQEGERLNLQPVRVSTGMPDLRRVFVRPGVAGCRADVALGSRVLVAFANGDPAAPVVLAFEDAEGGGFAPTRLDLVGEDDSAVSAINAAGRVIRYGDTIVFPYGSAGTPTEFPITILTPQTVSRVRA